MRRDVIAVEGLQYENSPVGLARQLGRFPGVLQVDVEPEAGIAEITYEESFISHGRLRELIEQCGYVVPRGHRERAPMPARRAELLETSGWQ